MPLSATMTPGKPPGGSPQNACQPSALRRPGILTPDIGVPYQLCRIKLCEPAYIPDLIILYNEMSLMSKKSWS